jgi:TatD DNase family protein
MPFEIVDTHSHLDDDRFDSDRDEVISRATAAGISKIVTVGTGIESCRKAILLAEKYSQIYAALGIHPHDAETATLADIEELEKLAKHPKVVAIGETGLDFFRNRSPRDSQVKVLKWQLALADKLKLPVVIHARAAAREMVGVLEEWCTERKNMSEPPGEIHCFSGDMENARQYIEMGFYLAFGAYIGYPKSLMPEVIKKVPRDRIILETDCPYLPPQIGRASCRERV